MFESVDLSGGPSAPAAPSRQSNSRLVGCFDEEENRTMMMMILIEDGDNDAFLVGMLVDW